MEAGDFIEQPALVQDARVLVGNDQDQNIGRAVGPYRIIECLGAGGWVKYLPRTHVSIGWLPWKFSRLFRF